MHPATQKAALLIGYDNGMINRAESEATFLANCEAALQEQPEAVLQECETYLAALTDQQLDDLCCGEGEQSCPDAVDEVLNTIAEL